MTTLILSVIGLYLLFRYFGDIVVGLKRLYCHHYGHDVVEAIVGCTPRYRLDLDPADPLWHYADICCRCGKVLSKVRYET